MTTTVEAKVLVPFEVYATLAKRNDRVRECINAAEQAMNETAAEQGRRICETPRLVQQRDTGLGVVELSFQADTEKR
jgi:hypothetical protein